MQKTFLLAGLLVLAVLAGCANQSGTTQTTGTPSLGYDPAIFSPSIYKIKPAQEIWVASSVDGKRMNGALYMPDVPAGVKVPVYINFSPYWDDSAMKEGDAFAQYMIHEYVPRGFAVVLEAVRGTGHSEGCFEVGSDAEAKDLYDVVDYFAKQPWSNGNIAAGAKSYDATTQNGMIAKFPHPALKGLFHVEGITDMYRYTYQDGVPARADSAAFNADYSAGQGLGEYKGGAAAAGGPDDESPASLARLADDAACPEFAMAVANPAASFVSGVKTPYWTERDWTRSIAASSWNGTIFFVHGFSDWNVQPSHILPWLDQVQANGKIHVLGWLHHWTHGDKEGDGSDGHVYPMRTDWNVTMLRWLDSTLKGKDTGMDKLWGYDLEDDALEWRHETTWPPKQGLQLAVKDAVAIALGDAPVHVSGQILLNVTATSTNPDPVITAVLYDGTTWIGEAVLRGTLRDSLETPSPVVPGTAITYHLRSYPLDHVFLAGHALTVHLGETSTRSVVLPQQLQGITYGAATAYLPTAGLELIEPHPTWMSCFTC